MTFSLIMAKWDVIASNATVDQPWQNQVSRISNSLYHWRINNWTKRVNSIILPACPAVCYNYLLVDSSAKITISSDFLQRQNDSVKSFFFSKTMRFRKLLDYFSYRLKTRFFNCLLWASLPLNNISGIFCEFWVLTNQFLLYRYHTHDENWLFTSWAWPTRSYASCLIVYVVSKCCKPYCGIDWLRATLSSFC